MLRSTQVTLKSPEEQARLRTAGRLAADVLDMIGEHVVPGVTTDYLDRICNEYIVGVQHTVPANVGYRGFPKTVCTSVNHVVCHGIPNDRVLKGGDLLNIDVAIIKDGYHGDTSRMYYLGKPPVQAQRLTETCRAAMWRATGLGGPGAPPGGIGHALQTHTQSAPHTRGRGSVGDGQGGGRNAGPAAVDVAPLQAVRRDWPLLERLPSLLGASAGSAVDCRQLLVQGQQELQQRFRDDEPVEALVRARAAYIDVLLACLWQAHLSADLAERLTLAAVGGYGRAELHPCSDVDIMVLAPGSLGESERGQVGSFLAFLWDIGLEVGNSVRTVGECAEESIADVGVMTTLLEARWLAGSRSLLPQMRAALAPDRVWPVRDYFAAKVREQQERHLKANDTAYNLEPDVKTGPGGLRDIQTIAWVAKRHFGAESLDELATHGFLTPSELLRLQQAQTFLWKVRFGLHVLTGRHEDRLLFDHQIRLAHSFGYEDGTYTLAVEQLMQRYYRTVMDVQLLNELLLQLFREAILSDDTPPKPLTPQFQVRDGSLEAVSEELFARQPSALLELFALLEQHPELRGVRAGTIRAVGRSLWLIDEEFRQNPRNHRPFPTILPAPGGATPELRPINNYGVLGRAIPAFGRVVGRMQYDLFHAYTVDAHTLFVVSNARRLAIPEFNQELPLVSPIMQQLPKQEIVYLGALFHDLAKGRGGDHSELGAVDAEAFCLEQGLSRYEARLVAWLVKHDLLFSVTAPKQDIGDPQVINEFARKIGNEDHR